MANEFMTRTAKNLLKQNWNGHNGNLARVSEVITQAIENNAPYMDLDEGEGYEILNDIRLSISRARKANDANQVREFRNLQARFELANHLYEGVSDDVLGMAIEHYHSMMMNSYAMYTDCLRTNKAAY